MKIKKGDNVIIISGKDKGKEGKVIKAIPAKEQVVVEGANIKKKNQRAKKGGQKGQIVEFSAPLHISNVMIKDPKTGKPTRVGMKVDGKKKVRITKASKSDI